MDDAPYCCRWFLSLFPRRQLKLLYRSAIHQTCVAHANATKARW
jgi:hypothetical protein